MPTVDVLPLTEDRWGDLVELFGRRGAAIPGRCWCTYCRRPGNGASASNRAGLDSGRSMGATLIEAYPIDKPGRSENEAAFVGTKPMFDRAGFREVARRSSTRPVMRRALRPRRSRSAGTS